MIDSLIIEEIEIINKNEKPYIEIKHNKNFSKLQNQLLYLLFFENLINKFGLHQYTNSLLKEMLILIEVESYANLFRTSVRNDFILLSNFIITKKIISDTVIEESFALSEKFFNNKTFHISEQIHSGICTNHQLEIYKHYFNLINKNTIFNYPNIFEIRSLSQIIKYPVKMIDIYFNKFNWNDIHAVKKQQVPLEILIKNICELNDKQIHTFSLYTLEEQEVQTLNLIKEML